MLRQPLLFGYWLPKHSVFDSLLTQSDRLPMVTYFTVQHLCDLMDVMLRHWLPGFSKQTLT